MLYQLADNLWTCHKPLSLFRVEFGHRMTVVRSQNELMLHSPVQYNEKLALCLAELGDIRYIVVPNLAHDLFIDEWRRAYPKALVLAPRSMSKLTADVTLAEHAIDSFSPHWHDQFFCHLIKGMPRLDESVFWHRPSATLILTDLAFNVGGDMTLWSKLCFHLYGAYGRFGPTHLIKYLIKDKSAFRQSIRAVLDWDFDRIILAHGGIIERNGKSLFENAFGGI